MYISGLNVKHWINDALMAIFFLLIGLKLERELYNNELSNFKNALLPIFATIGNIALPALIHFDLNNGTLTQAEIGIPMATDITFALNVLTLLKNHIPTSLKVFLTTLTIINDLVTIIVIAVFYTTKFSFLYLTKALTVNRQSSNEIKKRKFSRVKNNNNNNCN
jgi:NhaA family Na+:H+ antiporter